MARGFSMTAVVVFLRCRHPSVDFSSHLPTGICPSRSSPSRSTSGAFVELVSRRSAPAIEIRSGPLAEALVTFGRQTGASIVFGREAVAGQDSDEVVRLVSPAAALNLLLAGTCLTSEWIRPALVAIKQGCGQAPDSVPAIVEAKPGVTQAAPVPTIEEVFVVER